MERNTKNTGRSASQRVKRKPLSQAYDAKRWRAIMGKERHKTYMRSIIIEDRLIIEDLARMLNGLLDLDHVPPTIKPKKSLKVVHAILSYITKELKAGRSVILPYIGTLYVTKRRNTNNKYILMGEQGRPVSALVRLRPSKLMEKALLLDEF